jgi:hypothetical protein
MGPVTHSPQRPGRGVLERAIPWAVLAGAVLLAGAGCGWFQPAAPERATNQHTVLPNYTSADSTLVTIDRALEDKGTSNGLSAYAGAFADTAADSRGFHGFFDPLTLNRMQQLGVVIPPDWDLAHEISFYSKVVTVTIPLGSNRIDFFWTKDDTRGEDERKPDYAILHREYALFYTLSDTTRTVARGLATLRLEKLSPSRWAIVTWDDREITAPRRELGEISLGERRLEP